MVVLFPLLERNTNAAQWPEDPVSVIHCLTLLKQNITHSHVPLDADG